MWCGGILGVWREEVKYSSYCLLYCVSMHNSDIIRYTYWGSIKYLLLIFRKGTTQCTLNKRILLRVTDTTETILMSILKKINQVVALPFSAESPSFFFCSACSSWFTVITLLFGAPCSSLYITQEIQNVFFKFKVNISSLQKTHSGFNIIICEINLNLSTFLAPGHCRPLGAACNHSPAALRPSQAGPAHAVPCGLE